MFRILAGLLIVFCWNSHGIACFMLPVTYSGTIRQRDHEAVIIHHAGREELVLRINYEITGNTMPDNFAWVVTVPNEPDRYAIADERLFEDMFKLSEKLSSQIRTNRKRGGGGGAGSFGGEGVELGKHVEVGPYDIQPVRGVGTHALEGLNAWLKANGFPTEDPIHMKYFVEKNFTFLCVKVAASPGEVSVQSGGVLPPLHLSLASPKPYFPLRFSSRQGVFNVNLHVLSRRKLDYSASHRVLQRINWSNDKVARNYRLSKRKIPDSLRAVLAKSILKIDQEVLFYNNIRGTDVNSNNTIAQWKADVFLNGVPRKYSAAHQRSSIRVGYTGNENRVE